MARPYTAREKLRCIERELKFRNQVFPRRVHNGTMTQLQADREIYLMEEIAADYTAQVRTEEQAARSEAHNEPRPNAVYRR